MPISEESKQSLSFQEQAKLHVMMYVKSRQDKSDKPIKFKYDDVYVVWFCKTLRNWKCLLSTTLDDNMYYEVTYNGEGHVTYLDAYKKWENLAIPDAE